MKAFLFAAAAALSPTPIVEEVVTTAEREPELVCRLERRPNSYIKDRVCEYSHRIEQRRRQDQDAVRRLQSQPMLRDSSAAVPAL